MEELAKIAPEIAADIADYYRGLPDSTPFLDMLTPHAMAHRIASVHPDLGAAFYRLVAVAAKEAFTTRMGWVDAPPSTLPSISLALGGLINSKDSSWF